MKKIRPLYDLWRMEKDFPSIWCDVNNVREGLEDGSFSWPSWCFVPIAGCLAIVVNRTGGTPLDFEGVLRGQVLHALAGWRITKIIYRFDDFLAKELIKTPLQEIPSEIFLCLPAWSVYVDISNIFPKIDGVYVSLDYSDEYGGELRLIYCLPGGQYESVAISLTEKTVESGIRSVEKSGLGKIEEYFGVRVPVDLMDSESISFHGQILSLVLYLCSEKPDLVGDLPKSKKKKRSGKTYYVPVSCPNLVVVGERVGGKIKEAVEGGREMTSSASRPHVRRAHWHTFWTGKGRSIPVLRWLAPIIVNADNEEIVTTTIKKLKL